MFLSHRACLVLTLLSSAALSLGCQKEEAPIGPSTVVSEWIFKMRQVHGDEKAGRDVVDLLWKPARDNLIERARRASALSGRELSPGEMIAPSWFALHLVPEKTEQRIDGEWAEVTLTSAGGESVKARCIQEEGDWKVALELPPLAPIRKLEEPLENDQAE
jgi:hypothetical protein